MKNRTEENSVEWLKENGFDGLYYSNECACSVDDLKPFGEDCTDECNPGYKHLNPREGHKKFGDFCVSGSKIPPTVEEWKNMCY